MQSTELKDYPAGLAVYRAINAVQAEMAKEGISKDRKNQQQGYSFRGIDDCYAALSPHLATHKLCIIPRYLKREVTEKETKSGGTLFYVVIEGEFDFVSAEDGSKHTARMFGEAMDTADKASNKAASAAFKYLLLQTFCIPTEGDNDPDSHTHEPVATKKTSKAESFDYEKFRDRMLSNLMAHIEQAELKEYAVKSGILADESCSLTDWPCEHVPKTKEQMTALIERIKSFVAGVPLDAQPPVATAPKPVSEPKPR